LSRIIKKHYIVVIEKPAAWECRGVDFQYMKIYKYSYMLWLFK